MSGCLHLPDRLHEGIPDDYTDVSSGVAVCLFTQSHKIVLRQLVGGGAQMQFKHVGTSVFLRQRDVDSLFKPKTQTRGSGNRYEALSLLNPSCYLTQH